MSKIGCHVSIAGGIVNAPERAKALGCEVFQLFTRSLQGGPAPKITAEIQKEFKSKMKENGQKECYIHTPYYINFASAKKTVRDASARIVKEELERGTLIGAKYVMTHMGSSKDYTREEGLNFTAAGIKKILEGYNGAAKLLLEITAGAGNTIGDTFEELEYIIKKSGGKVDVCLDSAHMFASGYDIKSKESFNKVIKKISATVGIDKIKLIHSNDSKIELGGRRDRHDHIGAGKIGEDGFVNLLAKFKNLDFILETEHDKVEEDIKTLKKIRDKYQ